MARNIMANTFDDALDSINVQEVQTKPTAPPLTKSSGDWKKDQRAGYIAGYIPPKLNDAKTEIIEEGYFYGPVDAYLWLGLPYEGFPYTNEQTDPIDGKKVRVAAYLDPAKYSAEIGGLKVEWIAWDPSTQCNVYKRVKK